ncbi:MAG: efflux RND transporter periplasmic adaptor subunit [Alphaproteobacteria bacterium]|nr:efflux RND transporter periplasmic adaptor subunit [Alphaproteobacteria bacterium]
MVKWAILPMLLALAACSEEAPKGGAGSIAEVRPVRAETVRPASLTQEVRAAGVAQLKREITLSFKVAGIIDTISVDEGDRVVKGQALGELAQTEVAAQVSDAEAQLLNAERELKRAQELQAQGFASQARLDDARTAVQRAKANRDTLAFNRTWAKLEAPADGIILRRFEEAKEIVQAGAPILTVGDLSSGYILKAALSDRDIGRVRVGDLAQITFSGLGDVATPARVARIAQKADAVTGTFDVELQIDQPPAQLRSGMVGTASITVTREAGSVPLLAVSADAILEGQGRQAFVFVIDPQKGIARRQKVTVEGIDDGLVLISEGLHDGDQVVAAGAAYLRDGSAVTLADVNSLIEPAAPPTP